MKPHKACACGRTYTRAEWLALQHIGNAMGLEMRNCHCGSTICVRIEPRQYGAISAGRIGLGLTRTAAKASAVLASLGRPVLAAEGS